MRAMICCLFFAVTPAFLFADIRRDDRPMKTQPPTEVAKEKGNPDARPTDTPAPSQPTQENGIPLENWQAIASGCALAMAIAFLGYRLLRKAPATPSAEST